jgi:Protein of unknown function (DUF3105)
VSSRKEQKEKLRQERLAKEREAAAAEKRRRMMGFGVGGVLAVAAIAAVIVAVAAGGGGGDGPSQDGGDGAKTPIPAQRVDNLQTAARDAGCTLRSFTPGPNDRQHTEEKVTYKQNPPVFGPHNPQWASDGNYVGQGAPGIENVVHALEHGRVVIWYKPNLPARQISQLETLFAEPIEGKPEGYKQLLVEHPSMPFQVAATSWGQQLGCRTFTDQTFDALRTFRSTYVDKGPESVPFPE